MLDNFTGLGAERSEFAVGWTVGGGIEWGFAPGWSFKAEALFFDLDVDRLNTPNLVFEPVDIDIQHTGVIVRGGINYRFNWGGPPVVGELLNQPFVSKPFGSLLEPARRKATAGKSRCGCCPFHDGRAGRFRLCHADGPSRRHQDARLRAVA